MFEKKIEEIDNKLKKINDLYLEKKYNKFDFLAKNKSFNLIFGICVEFLSGGLFGFVCGYVFDLYFKTKPFGIIVFFIIGFIAGFLNMYRYVNKLLLKKENKEC